ncbi:hypothetical protein T07_13377 [Trichinella nelsoni]|uniref:Uncharacterized protein n=1 Tax=Trichinella nelsoni TaxID=6336 RepID=A0A0V0S639_9BILA|nr:hypothetical protein T07_13377 [Trichinella nelsoni]
MLNLIAGFGNIFLVFGDRQTLRVRHLAAFSFMPELAKKSFVTLSKIFNPAALSASSVRSSANASTQILLPQKS